MFVYQQTISLQWRLNVRDDVSNHQPHDCSLNRVWLSQSDIKNLMMQTAIISIKYHFDLAVVKIRWYEQA